MDSVLTYGFLDGLAITTLILAGLILFVSLDDIYVDARYWLHTIRRTLLMKRRFQPLPVDAIRAKEKDAKGKETGKLVPCPWQIEDGVMKISGEVEMNHNGGILDDEIEEGYILACCSRPIGDVSIEA